MTKFETPFQEVVTVINAFHQADVEVIDFFARTRAPKTVRDLKRLPPP